jgi:hypothetical protein
MPASAMTSIGNAMNKTRPPTILDDYTPRKALAEEIGVCQETLIRWERDGQGPPVTHVGRKPFYYRPSVMEWLRTQEKPSAA